MPIKKKFSSLAAIQQIKQCASKLASGGVIELKKIDNTNKVFTDGT